jgi:predicted LPLAT superfamily acyltransferase
MKEVDDCSDDDSGADEEFDLNKAFDLEGEEKSDELLEDFADEATCIREQCKEWDNEAKCKYIARIHVYCRLLSFDFFRLQS